VKRVCVAFGTRPEAVKMAPVVYALREEEGLSPLVLVTGQHREQLDDVLGVFGILPDADLKVMSARQTLPELIARIVPRAAAALRELRPDYVLVHGDTLTTFAVSLAAFYEGIPLGHVEAGLRSHDLAEPFPEEANRRLTDVLTDLDLPPTPLARRNLLAEGKDKARMVVTGNTEVDAVHYLAPRVTLPARLPPGPYVTITMHRRENLPVMRALAGVLADLARSRPDLLFVYPVHLNPAVREAVWAAMAAPNILLEDPWSFSDMLALMKASELIITDSGGLQEDGATLGVPVVVLRNLTERPEGVTAGVLKLAGNDPEGVRGVIAPLLEDPERLRAMRGRENPYGDGRAGLRVAKAVAWRLGLAARPEDWGPEGRGVGQ
jgi:UDP-N-acetylglucosamine 2-epimerase (non-hydrolysing)